MDAPDGRAGELEMVPENRAVLEALRASAQPARSEYRLDEFEQHVHPDVCERLEQVARAGRSIAVHGLCARATRGGVLYAIGMGTGSIALRLPDGPDRAAVLAHGGASAPDLGPAWVVADAWLSDVPRADGTVLLADWVEAARTAAGA